MNSEMDNNSDTLYSRLIDWLLQESVPAASPTAHRQAQGAVNTSEPTAADFELEQIDPLDFEEVNIANLNTGQTAQDMKSTGSPSLLADEDRELDERINFNLGEMPVLQNRFQELLKRRLHDEIERHPPLFPWETEISEYESDFPDDRVDVQVPKSRMWMPQLDNLSLPVPMPENVLMQLLQACAEAASSTRQAGVQLLKAVENLFPQLSPEQFQFLNRQAGIVLLGLPRDGTDDQGKKPQFPSYEAAATEQQMTMALLAAQEIISNLTMPVSPTQTLVERQWQTSVGLVTVQAEYQMQAGVPKLRVTSRLPRGGSLTLQTPQASAKSERVYPGYLSVESFDLQPNQIYPLEIRFYESEQTPLIFSICPTM